MTKRVNPLQLIALKNRIGQAEADKLILPTLIYFDAAKRGLCPAHGYNSLATTLLASAAIAAETRSKVFYGLVDEAYKMLVKAGMRPTKLLELTTTEYKTIRAALVWYVKSLPMVEIGVAGRAYMRAEAMMNE